MKKNKSSSIKKSIKRIGNFASAKFLSNLKLAQLKFKESLNSGFSNFGISKKERYKKILERINQFKFLKSSIQKGKKSKISDSLMLELSKKARYKKILERIKQFKILRI